MASLPPPDPRRWSAWWLARHTRRDSVVLTQRNVYILPTRAGWLCGLLLLVLLIGSINYQLNLGYLLTFVLASAAVASMHSAHANLRGLHLSLRAPEPVHAGEIAQLAVTLSDPAARPRRRHGLGLRLLPARLGAATRTAPPADTADWTWFDIADGASSTVTLDLQPLQRGWHDIEALRLETRFPFGLFCAWTLWRPAARLLAWPAPEQPAPPLPVQAGAGGAISRPGPSGTERDGVRAYRRGDALTQIAWKKSAQALTGGGELVSRDQPGAPLRTLTLRWADTADTPASHAPSTDPGAPLLPADPPQHRLARLSAWVNAAELSGAAWALDLPGLQLPAGRGEAHRRSALLALATWERPEGAAPAGALVPAAPAATEGEPNAQPHTHHSLAARALRQAGAPLPREARDTLFLLGVLGWTLLPQFTHVPPWCGGFAVAAIGWRAWLAWRGAALPPRWLLVVALAGAALLTWQQHHSLIGKEAGVSLLVLLAALKTLELRARRDHWVVFGLGFFLVLANFLFSQSLATALAMLAAVLGLLAALTLAHMPAGRPRLWRAARLASWQTLLGAPLVLLLFVFFPRVAPLWSVPSEGLARSGLSDQLRLGDVAELANDDSLAMRVRFDAAPPPPAALYFRGPVLSRHDGQTWRAESAGFSGGALLRRLPAEVEAVGAGLGYELTVEPLRVQTLPLLEMTLDAPQIDAGTPPQLRRLPDLQWVSQRPLAERLRVHAVAHLGVRWRAEPGMDLGTELGTDPAPDPAGNTPGAAPNAMKSPPTWQKGTRRTS
ncbi:MAG: transglutaminaseTgpA domain-containing protein [Leptothrix sp. (in: b-proteobacteria)]